MCFHHKNKAINCLWCLCTVRVDIIWYIQCRMMASDINKISDPKTGVFMCFHYNKLFVMFVYSLFLINFSLFVYLIDIQAVIFVALKRQNSWLLLMIIKYQANKIKINLKYTNNSRYITSTSFSFLSLFKSTQYKPTITIKIDKNTLTPSIDPIASNLIHIHPNSTLELIHWCKIANHLHYNMIQLQLQFYHQCQNEFKIQPHHIYVLSPFPLSQTINHKYNYISFTSFFFLFFSNPININHKSPKRWLQSIYNHHKNNIFTFSLSKHIKTDRYLQWSQWHQIQSQPIQSHSYPLSTRKIACKPFHEIHSTHSLMPMPSMLHITENQTDTRMDRVWQNKPKIVSIDQAKSRMNHNANGAVREIQNHRKYNNESQQRKCSIPSTCFSILSFFKSTHFNQRIWMYP